MKDYVFFKILLVLLLFIPKTSFAIDPPVITATGNQAYCPGTSVKIVQTIDITNDPAEPSTNAIYIQISSGYIYGQDQLTLTNTSLYPNIITSWDAGAGKLKLYSPTGSKILYTDFVNAIKDVVFSNSSASPYGYRNFSITIGQANYLPLTGHYYQFIPKVGITWTHALSAAAATNYYGLQGYLATITSVQESQLAGTQSSGAGWIGGNDIATQFVWKWVTGPENGTVFWNGGTNGSSPTFAFWNSGEPNNSGGNEHYAHITAPGVGTTGSWNDLSNTGNANGDYQPKGYIVEYGGMPGDPILHISASTTMTMAKITIITPSPTICATSTTTLQASSTTGTINWYDKLTGGNLLIANSDYSYTTPPLSGNTTYYIDNGCSPRTPIKVTVEPLPIANPVIIPRQCDDNQDGIFTFNTATLETDLLRNQQNVTVTYFDVTNNPLKDANGNLISSPFPATFRTKSQTIKAVVTNNTILKCSDETNIQFIVDVLPQAFPVSSALTTACDDELDPMTQDGKFAFDTSTFEATILRGQTGMKVTYTLQNGTVISNFSPRFITGTQNITATVTNPVNPTCTATTTLNFVVNPLPIVKDVTIVQCDTDSKPDGKTLFNLTVNNNVISANYTNENFTYYTSQSGANSGLSTDLILNDKAFENTTPSKMDVWARVANKITGCFSVAKLTLKVPATNLPYHKIIVPVCDDYLDAVNNNRDGIATFDFSSTKATILGQLANQNYIINYYRNKADALAELNAIAIDDIKNYRNIGYPNSQDIWVRVESSLDNACVGLVPYITLKVEALPFANPVTIPRKCDDNQDGIFTFDTANLESTLLNGQKLSDVTVTYFDESGTTLPSPFPATFRTKSQTIKAVVTNNTILKCSDETNIQFIVDVLPQAFPVSSALTTACDDELDPMTQDGKFAFDTSTFEATILRGQTGMKVTYTLQNGTVISNFSPRFITGTQNITATVTNPVNPTCTAKTTLNFVVNPLPKINLNTDGGENELVCSNLPSFFVTLNAGIQDGSSPNDYNYIWRKDGSVLSAPSPTLQVNAEGTYTVEVTNKSNGCSRIRTIKVTASNKATIDTIEIIDLTDLNTVTVNVTGPGNYEYSLDESSGYWQDSKFFNNVPAGIHEVFVNDKNGCGIVSKTIAVIGAPKFFTPNNDGYNDYWSVKGVNETFNSKSIIYIFDRYGKLIKQWVPSFNQGWDGTFNGTPLPADDYWFTLKLEDGREVKGHFSLKR